jgi:hypothetical protein
MTPFSKWFGLRENGFLVRVRPITFPVAICTFQKAAARG